MYKDWGETFYPPDLRTGHLSFLARAFNTVEINTSFYHLPKKRVFSGWREQVPEDFLFAVKMSRYVTHRKRLESAAQPVEKFLRRAKALGSACGPILVQLPPSLAFSEVRLDSFLADVRRACARAQFKPRFALEPRHPSWFGEGLAYTRRALASERIAIVFAHSKSMPHADPDELENLTADFTYVRFHGPSEFAASRYGRARLLPWAARMAAWRRRGFEVFSYFNNDRHGHAVVDAHMLERLAKNALKT